jgi:superoxide dismutase, Cu-Zn family
MTIRNVLSAVLPALALVAAGGTLAGAEKGRKAATAVIKDAKGQTVGSAKFKQTAGGVSMSVKVMNLSPGVRAIHIHEMGKCDPPDYKSAGGHFNPEKKQHGLENPAGHHLGDMPNLTVNAKGKGTYQSTLKGVTLAGNGANSLFKDGGTSVVIHAQADDMKTDPAGNAGARVACGLIQ